MDITHSLVELAYAIRRAVRPHLGQHSSRIVTGKAASGDETFAIDVVAEHAIEDFLRKHDLPVAYYSEDKGLVAHGHPKYTLIIDPIDGTRPAMAGFEDCVVSIAMAPYRPDIMLADVTFACILEMKNDRLYTATRGGDVRIREGEHELPVTLSMNADIDKMAWSFEIAGRPSEMIIDVLSQLLDQSSLRGGVFVFNSIAYSLTRLISGQLNAHVDVGQRIVSEYPHARDRFVKAGLGTVVGVFSYDIAAAVLIAETAGCTVTDAYGNSLDSVRLLDTSEQNVLSCVAASNPLLHQRLMSTIDASIRRLNIS